jgi:phospholipid/cholesterol/gamma-HCH transport system permease protein
MSSSESIQPKATLTLRKGRDGGVQLQFAGNWRNAGPLASLEPALQELRDSRFRYFTFDTTQLTGWDSGFVVRVQQLLRQAEVLGGAIDRGGLPEGVNRLLQLAEAVPAVGDEGAAHARPGLLTRIGRSVGQLQQSLTSTLVFVGEVVLSFTRLLTGRARFRFADLLGFSQACGIEALPIVSLISVLVGLILAFMGALQLAMFGAEIFVANLVAIGMLREMGAMMTAIIMAGRTGAAYAAQLGTMQVNEEIDAFNTFGIQPIDFLVLPRMLALILMMPLLCLYADLLGILGGMVIGIGVFDISALQYLEQTRSSVGVADLLVGLVKSLVFAVLIGIAGCLRGMRCGRSSAAVGQATTSAVVTAIVAIVVADSLITLIANAQGI